MVLIFYRDGTGKIIRTQRPPIDWPPERLAAEIEKFNSEGDVKAYSQELKEDSLEFYLYEYAQKQRRYTKDTIQAALDAIEEARDCINSLEAAP